MRVVFGTGLGWVRHWVVLLAVILAPAVLGAASPYAGIYTGEFEGWLDSGGFAVFVSAEGKAIYGGYSRNADEAFIVDGVSVPANGQVTYTARNGDRVTAVFTAREVSGMVQSGTGGGQYTFFGQRRPAWGVHQEVAGYYRGSYSGDDRGTVHAIVSADGGLNFVSVTANPSLADDDAVICSIGADNQLAGCQSDSGLGVGGVLKPASKVISGHWAMEEYGGTYTVTRQRSVAVPTVKVESHKEGVRVTAAAQRVAGSVVETGLGAGGVSGVWYQLNGGAWQEADGTTAWQADVLLMPGVNAFRAYAVDWLGNHSPTGSVSLTYVVMAPLTVEIDGKGTVSPNYHGKDLEVGKTYTMTAKAGAGFKFVEWTDGAGHGVTNKPAVKFVMQAGLVLVAHFVDGQKPVVTITAPANAARVTAHHVTVTGKATDNGEVAAVKCQVNDGPWVEAQGTGTWEAHAMLVPGPNVIRVQAVDGAGNVSTTVSRNVTYLVVGRMTVTIEGQGTVNPNYNGKDLEIGKAYTMTATPKAGFKFVEWTDGAGHGVTNKPGVKFVMQAGLVLVAHFVDGQKPVVTITAPANAARVTTHHVTLTGKATDNGVVAAVKYQVNDGPWVEAQGTGTWEAQAMLVPGPNVIRVQAVDGAGNVSTTVSRNVTYVVVGRMTVKIEGQGTVNPNYDGKDLEIGKTYTMTAAPKAGSKFVKWTDGAGAVVTNKPAVKFVMAEALVLQANFADGLKPTVKVTAPKAGQKVGGTEEFFMVTGTAADNVGVVEVWLKNNDGEWVKAEGTTAWELEVALAVGSNTVRVYAKDAAGNESAVVTVAFTYQPSGTPDAEIRTLIAGLKSRLQAHDVAGFTALFASDYLQNGQTLTEFKKDLAKHLKTIKTFDFTVERIEVTGDRALVHGMCRVTYNDGSPTEEWTEPNTEGDGPPGFGYLKKTAQGWRVHGNQMRSEVYLETGHNLDQDMYFFWAGVESADAIESVVFKGPGFADTPLQYDDEHDEFWGWLQVPSPRPAVGTVYTFEIDYKDGSREIRPATIDSYVPTAPTITVTVTGTSAKIQWNNVSSQVPDAVCYDVQVYGFEDDVWWEMEDLPLTRTSVTFNEDGTAEGRLQRGHSYGVQLMIYDKYYNYATRSDHFTVPTLAGLAASDAVADPPAVVAEAGAIRRGQFSMPTPSTLAPTPGVAEPAVGAEAAAVPVVVAQFASGEGASVVADGQFLMTVTGTPGASVVLESSMDLRHWTRVQTATLNEPVTRLAVPKSHEAGGHFYRLRVE